MPQAWRAKPYGFFAFLIVRCASGQTQAAGDTSKIAVRFTSKDGARGLVRHSTNMAIGFDRTIRPRKVAMEIE